LKSPSGGHISLTVRFSRRVAAIAEFWRRAAKRHLMKIGDREYESTLTTDLATDSMLLELDDLSGGVRQTVADVRFDDGSGVMTFTAYRHELPIEAVEYLIAEARRRLAPARDA
jgi:hypothetical protein